MVGRTSGRSAQRAALSSGEALEALANLDASSLPLEGLLDRLTVTLGAIGAVRAMAVVGPAASAVRPVSSPPISRPVATALGCSVETHPATADEVTVHGQSWTLLPMGRTPTGEPIALAYRPGPLPESDWKPHRNLALSLLRLKVQSPGADPAAGQGLDSGRIARLYAILRALEPTQSPADLARLVLEHLHPFVSFDVAGILLEERGKAFVTVLPARPICAPLEVSFATELLAEHLSQSETPTSVENYELTVLPGSRDGRVTTLRAVGPSASQRQKSEKCLHGPLGSRLSLPLIVRGGQIVGRLVLGSSVPDLYGPDALVGLSTLAGHLSTLLANRRLLLDLEREARLDGMTELYNYRTFRKLLASELSRSTRHGKPLSLILLDIDHFKQINDTFGHPKGDEVLRKIGQLMMATKRREDVVARYGGEEFVMILPETTQAGARRLAERMRNLVAQTVTIDGRAVTASFGISTTAVPGRHHDLDLISAADAALYRAKGNGRNRVEIAG